MVKTDKGKSADGKVKKRVAEIDEKDVCILIEVLCVCIYFHCNRM